MNKYKGLDVAAQEFMFSLLACSHRKQSQFSPRITHSSLVVRSFVFELILALNLSYSSVISPEQAHFSVIWPKDQMYDQKNAQIITS